MAAAARDELARMLREFVRPTFSVELTARPDDLELEVEGLGPVEFPVTPEKARELIGLGRPAPFGRGEETVTDPEVRDTWEIPRELVRATWDPAVLDGFLSDVEFELELWGELTAELHSLLVYEPDQFFLVHQDSEKDDAMVGTLVVTLPSDYRGGELRVGHNGEWETYRGGASELSAVAFYADCQHEVLRVQSGYRITLTYNVMRRDFTRVDEEEHQVTALGPLLREHFTSLSGEDGHGTPAEPPNRLVYLLDHEYTPRGLGWTRLKGADTTRATLLRTAAERNGYEAVLALARVETRHRAYPDGFDDDAYDAQTGTDGLDILGELTEPKVTLTHWTAPDGRRLEQTSLEVAAAEVCASTENGDLVPYSLKYEGYVGNWGNSLDRRYHRAAVIVWPRAQAFANRAELSPVWALDELAAMAASGDLTGAREAAAILRPFWESAMGRLTWPGKHPVAELAGKGLRTAAALEDRESAALLLRPFRVENLDEGQAGPLAALAVGYGQEWSADLLRVWFVSGPQGWPYDPYAYSRQRLSWLADRLRGLSEGLALAGDGAGITARLLLDQSWAWLRTQIDGSMGVTRPSMRDGLLHPEGEALAGVLATAGVLGSASVQGAIREHLGKQGAAVTVLELSALRALAVSQGTGGSAGEAEFRDLAADCAARLSSRLAAPARADGDWSIRLPPGGCTCEPCATLTAFLSDPRRRTFDWPLPVQTWGHVHRRIDDAEIPVAHVISQQGSSYTFVLTKTDELFAGESSARAADAADLEWLTGRWDLPG